MSECSKSECTSEAGRSPSSSSLCRQVSQISSVFECLLEEEERSLKENPVDSVQWAEVVLNVNSVIKVQPG